MVDNKVAIVTGGTRGIGADISLELAGAGFNILSVYKSNEKKATAFLSELRKISSDSNIFKADVSLKSEVDGIIEYVDSQFGRIDVLVNNAGIFDFYFLDEMPEDFLDEIMRVNFKSQVLMIQACSRFLKLSESGRILNASSISGTLADVGLIGYGASKAAVDMMTKIAAAEFAPFGITVNAYAPGIIHTDLTDEMIQSRGDIQVRQIPLNRFGKGKEVGAMVKFLVSPEAGYITGQIIGIDGGMFKVQNPIRAHEYYSSNS